MRNFIPHKRTIFTGLICALAVMICGCTADKNIPEETEQTISVSVTENYEYALVRGWTGSELMSSVFYCGEFHPLPLDPEENEGFSFSDGILTFPDGSFASAITDENGIITSLKFERNSAPKDFSVYGIDFSSVPDDIPDKVGIAESVYGDKEETITYSFYGGGIGGLTFVYTYKNLVSVQIAAEA